MFILLYLFVYLLAVDKCRTCFAVVRPGVPVICGCQCVLPVSQLQAKLLTLEVDDVQDQLDSRTVKLTKEDME
jgi:nitrate reductase beta subunit